MLLSKLKKPPPAAYTLALTLQPTLHAEFKRIQQELGGNGCSQILEALQHEAKRGSAAMNMTMPRLNRFLETGAWLNIYEAVAQRTNTAGSALEAEVAKVIPGWYEQRKRTEELLHLSHNTHYASLNIGGMGPSAWGECCVILDLRHWKPFYTCYGGDTVRSAFDPNRTMVLGGTATRSLFAVGRDAYRVATIKHRSFIEARRPVFPARPAVDRAELVEVFEHRDSLIELHLHGPVTVRQIEEVRMARALTSHLWAQSLAWERLNRQSTQDFEQVPHFLKLVELLRSRGITLYEV